MNLLTRLFQSFTQPAPVVGCVLPPMVVRAKTVKQPKERDGYWIDEATRTMGFNTATAINQNDGAVPDLTPYDVDELKVRVPSLWGQETTPRGRTTNANNLRAKAVWYSGGDASAIAKAVGNSVSWAEKRCGAFETALKNEIKG